MSKKILHQFVESIAVGDATSDHVFLLRDWLREAGFVSEIYTMHCIDEKLTGETTPYTSYRPTMPNELIIFHHAIGSDVLDYIIDQAYPIILIYHNVTPPEFFATTNPALTRQLVRGLEQLKRAKPLTRLALSDSAFSEGELQAQGFPNTGVLPIVLDERPYTIPINQTLQNQLQQRGPMLLFVGRLAPNKKQEDLIKLLYFYRRIQPDAHLVLVGSLHGKEYVTWLQAFAEKLGVADAVTMTGHVSQQDMVTYYKTADLFVSMSEHEGFGKPLIESMYLGLPVMGYGVTAVPHTLGSAGILFHQKDFEALAELTDILIQDTTLRTNIIAKQKQHVQIFLEPYVRNQWQGYLDQL